MSDEREIAEISPAIKKIIKLTSCETCKGKGCVTTKDDELDECPSCHDELSLKSRDIQGLLRFINIQYKSQSPRIQELEVRVRELKQNKLSDLFLANFPYEDWDCGEDSAARLLDWVELNWQDHNGNDHTDGIGRIVLHHQTDIPVILMVEGFEDDGIEPHGTYASMCFHPWNTMRRISDEKARAALTDAKEG